MSTGGRISWRTLARVFWRCLFLQAAWNRRGMQNLGFAYAVDPALRELYGSDRERREQALRRHLGFFNCHPYMAAAIVGGVIHHEERVAAGAEPTDQPQEFKVALQGPFAAVGDGFFWTALRPFFGALSAVGALLFGWRAIVAALAVYNAIHLALRIHLFWAGYRKGDALVDDVARLGLPVVADRLRAAGAAICGVAAAILVARGSASSGASTGALAVLAAGAGYFALARGARLLPTAYLAVLFGIGAALVAGHLGRSG